MGVIVERLSDNYPTAEVAAALDRIKNLCYRYATQSGLTVSIDDVAHAEGQARAARRLRGAGREGREPVPARHHHRRRAPPAGGPHLDRRHQGRPGRDGGRVQVAALQPDRHDGRLGRPREHDPDAPDRRHARPRGQPPRRHDPAPDQVELPRGPRDARVLHRHAGRPQGPRRHGAAYRRLGLPDAPSRRRRPGADRPRGGLRHDARHPDQQHPARHRQPAHTTSRPSCSAGRCSTTSRLSRRHGSCRARTRIVGDDEMDAAARRPGDRPGAGSLRAHVRRRARRVRAVLRPLAGDRQVDRARRGGRRDRRPVDRRARHAADDAHLPHRWCGRQGHRRRSAPCGRAVRGPHARRVRPASPGRPACCASARTRARASRSRSSTTQGEEHEIVLPLGARPSRSSTAWTSRPATRSPTAPSIRRS